METIRFRGYPQYKGIYYKFEACGTNPQFVTNSRWVLSDTEEGYMNLMYFNADHYRIDQCFDLWFKRINNENTTTVVTAPVGASDVYST